MALPERIFAHASPKSVGGRSLFDVGRSAPSLLSVTPGAFSSNPSVIQAAANVLRSVGFELLQVTPFTINIAGPPDLFEKSFKTKISETEVARPEGPTVTYLDAAGTDMMGLISTEDTPFRGVIEGVALEVPRDFFAASPTPPVVDYWHLKVPADVALASNAAAAQQYGITGRGVRVAIVDSGWFRHPFFVSQGYNVAPVVLGPGASEPDVDESGHGTGESANILALAPDCELLPVKMNFVNTIGAFNQAVALHPDIITCSWGSHSPFALSAADIALEASVAAAVAAGITVIFSAGNGHAGFPGQHPDVISAGGVFVDPFGNLEASNYSSGFQSLIFPGRNVPDVCGLVGMRPKAIYIMLPVEPGDNIDAGNAGSVFPDGDQTEADDGWAAFSGTSAAAPQLAGAAALIKQIAPSLSPSEIKYALMATARNVTAGTCSPVGDLHQGLPAGLGPNVATGTGLFDAFNAVVYAYLLSTFSTGMAAPQAGTAETGALVAAYWQGAADAAAAVQSMWSAAGV